MSSTCAGRAPRVGESRRAAAAAPTRAAPSPCRLAAPVFAFSLVLLSEVSRFLFLPILFGLGVCAEECAQRQSLDHLRGPAVARARGATASRALRCSRRFSRWWATSGRRTGGSGPAARLARTRSISASLRSSLRVFELSQAAVRVHPASLPQSPRCFLVPPPVPVVLVVPVVSVPTVLCWMRSTAEATRPGSPWRRSSWTAGRWPGARAAQLELASVS